MVGMPKLVSFPDKNITAPPPLKRESDPDEKNPVYASAYTIYIQYILTFTEILFILPN
jgi:hypothetical protein